MLSPISYLLFPADTIVHSGTFIEFRNGMINVSPIGRNASYVLLKYEYVRLAYVKFSLFSTSVTERNEFEAYDKVCAPLQLPQPSEPWISWICELIGFYSLSESWRTRSICQGSPRKVRRLRANLLHWWSNILRRLPQRMGQDLLPATCWGWEIRGDSFLRWQDIQGTTPSPD